MTLPPIIRRAVVFPSDPPRYRTALRFSPEREGDPFVEVIGTFDGDGPSMVFTPETARAIAAELVARADLLERQGPTVDRLGRREAAAGRLRAVIQWLTDSGEHARAVELDSVVHELETHAARAGAPYQPPLPAPGYVEQEG